MKLPKWSLLSTALLCMASSTVRAQDKGAATYQSKCQMCHGADGRSETPTGKAFKAPDLHSPEVMKLSDEELIKTIGNGKGNMPAFSSTLTAAEIQDVISYIHGLQSK